MCKGHNILETMYIVDTRGRLKSSDFSGRTPTSFLKSNVRAENHLFAEHRKSNFLTH